MNIAIICARAGSKRVKNKNFLFIKKKRLIDYTIEAAIKSKIFKYIYVNTDKKNFYYNKNAKVKIYSRPKKLSGPKVRVLNVIKEMIIKEKIKFDTNLWILFPTCPLRNFNDIIKSKKIYHKYFEKKQVISVTEYNPSIDVSFFINKKGFMKNFFPKLYNRSPGNNNHRKSFYCNYGIIVTKTKKLLLYKKLVNENAVPYVMPFERSIDIDEPYQLKLIKKLFE